MVGYTIPILLFERGLGLVNFFAMLSFYRQLPGLVGSRGIKPAKAFMQRQRRGFESNPVGATGQATEAPHQPQPHHLWHYYSGLLKTRWRQIYTCPTLFWLSTEDWFLHFVCILGLCSSAVACLGLASPPIALFISLVHSPFQNNNKTPSLRFSRNDNRLIIIH